MPSIRSVVPELSSPARESVCAMVASTDTLGCEGLGNTGTERTRMLGKRIGADVLPAWVRISQKEAGARPRHFEVTPRQELIKILLREVLRLGVVLSGLVF